CFEQSDGLRVTFAYSADLFEEATVRQFVHQYVRILRAFASTPARSLCDLELLEDVDREALLARGSGEKPAYPADESLGRLFEQQAALRHDAIALEGGPTRLTYAALNARANQVAHALIGRGASLDAPVGVWMRRGIDLIVTLVGIVKAGCAYVAVDPND